MPSMLQHYQSLFPKMKDKLKISPVSVGAAVGSTIGSYIAYKTKSSFWVGQGIGFAGGVLGFALVALLTSSKK